MSLHHRFTIVIALVFALIVSLVPTAAILHAGETSRPMQTHDFVDVPVATKEWMEPFINDFYHQGITGGCANPPLQFCPEDNVTRAEMAVFIGRALGYRTAVEDGFKTEAYFKNTNTGSNQFGVVGRSIDSNGVYGTSTNGDGVFGLSSSGNGVQGFSTDGAAVFGSGFNSYGVQGFSNNDTGVYGEGEINGVMGASTDGYGVYAVSSNATGLFASGGGDTANDSLFDIQLDGVVGEIYAGTMHLFSDSDIVLDLDQNNNSDNTLQVRNGTNNVVMELSENGTLTVNHLNVSGDKLNIVDTVHYGTRKLYAVEATEAWFEDFGSARLVNGIAVIEIDPMYAETVNLAEAYHIYLTPMGSAEVLYIEQKTPTSFIVRSANRSSNIQFDYRIVAKRLGYEDVRMEEVTD